MAGLRRLVLRLFTFLRWSAAERELSREIAAHLAFLEDEYERRGLTPEDARLAARRALGGVDQTKERQRDERSLAWLEDFRRDCGYSLRAFVRTPGFTLIAVLTLALGIGANTAIFSVVNALLMKRPSYAEDSDRLVRLIAHVPAEASPTGMPRRLPIGVSAAEAADLQSRSRTLTHVGTADGTLMGIGGHEGAARVQGARVSATVFAMLDARPLIGRVFEPADERPGAEATILLSHAAWQQYFAGDPAIVGRTLPLDSVLGPRTRRQYSVIGVMPPAFVFPHSRTQFWIPPATGGPGPIVRSRLLGRLADSVSTEAALAEIGPIVRAIRQDPPAIRYELLREQDELVAPVKPALLVLMAAVGFVLLIACVNVANLLLARTAARSRELAVRAALGAGRSRLIRQALTEAGILAVLGGIAGIVLALGGIRLLRALATTMGRFDLTGGAGFPRLDEIGIDTSVLMFTAATSMMTGVLFGLAPALRQWRCDPMHALTHASGSADPRVGIHQRVGVRTVLVVSETAMAMVLLVSGGLLIHSFMNLTSVDPGFEPQNVLTFQVALPVDQYPDARLKTFAEELTARLRSLPQVRAAGFANQVPMVNLRDTAGGLWRTPDPTRRSAPDAADARFVSRDYLDVMGIRIVEGRGFGEHDRAGQSRVLLVNQALVRRDFAGHSPVGQIVYIGRDPTPCEIVGVVEDVRQFGLDLEPTPQFFGDLRQWSGNPLFPVGAYYAVRANDNPEAIIASLRAIVRALDPQAALFNVAPMTEVVATTISRARLYAALLGIFAGVGVVLAVIGIYGVLAYTVTQRTSEIGIRMALGAQRTEVMALVLRQSLAVTTVGILIGVFGAAGVTRYLEGMLFGLTPLDTRTFVAVSVLFAAVATLASYVPARRATKVDPVIALRHE